MATFPSVTSRRLLAVPFAVALLLGVSACSDDDDDDSPGVDVQEPGSTGSTEEMTDESAVDEEMTDESMTEDSTMEDEMTDESMVEETTGS